MKISILIPKLNRLPFLEKSLVLVSQQKCGGKVRGYTIDTFAEINDDVIEKWPHLESVYQLSFVLISRYDLLSLLDKIFNTLVDIEPYPDIQIDCSLDNTRFRNICNFTPPSWTKMVQQMVDNPTPYHQWRI